jgi:hypothetical protein
MDKNLVEFPETYITIQQETVMSILLGRTLPDDLTKPKQNQVMICLTRLATKDLLPIK